ncbi:hypothetical protein [Catalinimonas niigatensis]|uniref:hypothetical protein n=1 Tax=Catalinimonas niigatensis TaxID=1397264 RepID=UPI0026659C0D|nr:hypothetical protein [Catalinimonas niigatensis]WPP48242.1 hypothetical protein PZB72_16345 [Catalinimonas niigatensis]
MNIENPLHNIQEKLLELSYGDFIREKKLAEQYFKSFQDLKDLYAVSLINQDIRLLSFIYQKYIPVFKMLNLLDLEAEIQSTIHTIKKQGFEVTLEASAFKVKTYCDTLIHQLQLHYIWLN